MESFVDLKDELNDFVQIEKDDRGDPLPKWVHSLLRVSTPHAVYRFTFLSYLPKAPVTFDISASL